MTSDLVSESDTTETRSVDLGRLFWAMWAIAHILHLWLLYDGGLRTVTGWLTMLAAVALLRDPGHKWLPAVLAITQLLDVFHEAPEVADHWALVGASNIVILLLYAVGARGSAVVERAAPVFRTLLLVGYTAAALAKWNSDFLDPAVSCAAYLGSVASLGLSEKIPGSGPAQVALSVGVESMIPILLLIPRTRSFGARLGIVFHFFLSLSPRIGVEDFTTTLFAFFILFIPHVEIERGVATARRLLSHSDIARQVRAYPTRALALIVLAGGVLGHANGDLSNSVSWAVATVYGFVVVVAAVGTASQRGRHVPWGRAPLLLALPALLLALYATSPYIGGRTTGVFTMFSNLRTESAENHLFLPSGDLLGYHGAMVELRSVNDDVFQPLVDEGLSLAQVEVARLTGSDAELQIQGVSGGQEVRYGPRGDGAIDIGWVERKALQFRPVRVEGGQICSV